MRGGYTLNAELEPRAIYDIFNIYVNRVTKIESGFIVKQLLAGISS
jgi:hypothetical protein